MTRTAVVVWLLAGAIALGLTRAGEAARNVARAVAEPAVPACSYVAADGATYITDGDVGLSRRC